MKVPLNLNADYYYDAIMRPYVTAAAVLPSSSLPSVGGEAVPYSSGVALPITAFMRTAATPLAHQGCYRHFLLREGSCSGVGEAVAGDAGNCEAT